MPLEFNPSSAPATFSDPERTARLIAQAHDAYVDAFEAVTRRAPERFVRREWPEGQQDARERLTLYREILGRLIGIVAPEGLPTRQQWAEVKRCYVPLVTGRPDAELAGSFFNSATRRLFVPIGVEPDIEFDRDPWRGEPAGPAPIARRYLESVDAGALVRAILADLPFASRFRDLRGDADLAGIMIDRDVGHAAAVGGLEAEMIPQVFYRNKGAFIVGRLRAGTRFTPLVLALVHDDAGITVDAVLLRSDDVSSLFGFTRSYFHVDTARPRALVSFLSSIMPLKRIDELYTAIGYNKHGKTELYRELMAHLGSSDVRFEPAEGDKGLVMAVFALPSLNLVFKIIKDRFGFPKNITRRAVMDKYHLVFIRDRVGRLADAHEFEHLAFRRDRFAPEVLDELLREAGRTVQIEGDLVVLRHVYVERRVMPLNLYLREAGGDKALHAALDYGNAIKDLAVANIFTGDMLLKNFGVTRHGRVIFYDYDELCLLTECNFRRLPPPRDQDEEFAAEPWFSVGERDVFPEEFASFMLLPGELGQLFRKAHGDLFTVEFWQEMQARQQAGEVVDFFAYPPDRRLRAAGAVVLPHP